jgi:hypothetical protein
VTLTLSAPVRIAAVCGLALALLLPAGLMFMGHGSDSTVATTHVITHHPFGPGVKAKTTHKAAPTPTPATTQKPARPAKEVRPVERQPALNRGAVEAARSAGLPAPLAEALGLHDTVVVSLYDPYSQVDAISFAEAKAGAALAQVGFVPLDVLSQAQVGKLTEQLGLLPDPGVLVYVRPGRLAVKIGGFADKETVAQAAANAGT